jgi:hypothetical protein
MLENKRGLGAGDAEASHQDRHTARGLNNKGADAGKSPRDSLTEQRLRLRRGGFAPIPVGGKKPAIQEWQKKTDVADAEIEAWREHKGTGLLTRLMPALDIDIYNPEAAKAVEDLVRKHFQGRGKVLVRIGNAPKFAIPFRTSTPFKKITATLITPEDDLTADFRRRGDSFRPMDQKIELLCDGQQLVAFGIHPETRKSYRWIDGEPGEVRHDELPEITEGEALGLVDDVAQLLCDKFGYTRRQRTATGPENATHAPNNRLAADDITELAAAVDVIPNDIPGWEDWNSIVMAIWAATGGSEKGFEIADRWCAKWEGYDANETRKRWKAISKSPPNRIGAGTIYHMADKASPGWRRQYETEKIAKILANRKEEKEAADDPTGKTCISATPFNWIDPKNIPQRQWLYRPHYIRKFESATISTGGVGKSSLVIAEALAMVSGKPLLGVWPQQKLRVWYWNGEDPADELLRRFIAGAIQHKLTPEDIGDRLFVDSGRTMPIVMAEGTKSGTIIAAPVIKEVIATLLDKMIDVLIVDPFVSCHQVPENDNSGIERVAKSWSRIADTANASVMLVHHSRKTYGNEMTVEDGRGASALIAATRTARVLNTMSKTDGDNLGVTEAERRRFFRSDIGKANLSRPAERADWFTIESVQLGNGALGMGDEVGVVQVWEIPDDLHSGLDAEGIRKIQAALGEGGPWREDPRSKVEQWAGEPFAEALGVDITRKLTKDWVIKGLRTLTRAGYLKRVVGHDRNREKRAYIEPGNEPADDARVVF